MSQRRTKNGVTRRDFLVKSALGAGVAAAAIDGARSAIAQTPAATTAESEIRVAEAFTRSLGESPRPAEFGERGMTGAQVFARVCRLEELGALFCCPGNYQLINALAAEGVPTYGGRTEGAMCAAADGFIRVSGSVAACSGTEGPGFTNMIMNVAAANAARTPLLVLASNKSVQNDDTESQIQVAYQQPTTVGMRKYGKRLITPNRIYEYAAYAFRQLKTGVPGPVHLDFPAEVTRPRFTEADLEYYYDRAKYRTESEPHPGPKEIAAAVELIRQSRRPMIVAGAGVFYGAAWDPLKRLAERNDIAVVESGPTRGHFSDAHRLSASAAPDALVSADLVIFVGQYCMPPVGEFFFNMDAKFIRIDRDPADIGRNWPIDLGMVSGERGALEALAEAVPAATRESWVAELAAARKSFEDENLALLDRGVREVGDDDVIHPAQIAKELHDFLYKGDIPPEQTTVVQGGYGIARQTRRWMRALRPGQILNGAYQYGAIGPDVGYTVGAAAAVQLGAGAQAAHKGHPVVAITGDAGFGYTGMEIETLCKYRLPAVVVVYNNNAWGVWTSGAGSPRATHMYLFQENVRYDKMAEALGGRGEYVTRAEQLKPALERSYRAAVDERATTVINCQSRKEFRMTGKVEPGCMAYWH
jgi:thiamine pyrophosphate-dependent acetolactate synthase large subunit-like protein